MGRQGASSALLPSTGTEGTYPISTLGSSLMIRETPLWAWRIHTNQAHLGHIVFVAQRETQGSLADCSGEEWSTLRCEITLYERVMAKLFAPDRFNYTQFGNEWAQLHVHAFPRYRSPREWNALSFPDVQWGGAPIPEPPSPLEGKALEGFAVWFQEKLLEIG